MIENKVACSEIQNFYNNKTIFITGGTGFVGKVLIEKLLRICYGVHKIYILVRQKRGKTEQERFREIFNFECFNNIKKLYPNFYEKVQLIHGDCSKKNLNLSSSDYELIKQNVEIVVHAASNVKFDLNLREAINTNVHGVEEILRLGHLMPRLKALVYVSTAYSNCPNLNIKEEFYQPPMKANLIFDLVDDLDDATLESITPKLLRKWPNTYAFSKCIAEDLVHDKAGQLPIVIIRPAILISSRQDPIPGWIDNFYGIVGICTAFMMGAIKVLCIKDNIALNCIPCDHVVDTILAAIWDVSDNNTENVNKSPIIYNCATTYEDSLPISKMWEIFNVFKWNFPPAMLLSYPYSVQTEKLFLFKILAFLLHTIPAYIADFVLLCLGKKRMVVSKIKKVNKQLELTSYFMLRLWKFDVNNLDKLWSKMSENDKQIFNFNMKGFNWDQYMENTFCAGRYFLLNDPPETIPKAKIKLYLHTIFHFGVLIPFLLYFLFYVLFYKIMYGVFTTIF